jgi:excisionase family DNA binding protein
MRLRSGKLPFLAAKMSFFTIRDMDANEKWYPVKEFAASLAVGRDTVSRWIQRGVLRAFKFPCSSKKRTQKFNSYRISESERERFIRSWMTS